MPIPREPIPIPLGGWHTESAASEQPPGTTPSLLNVIPVDTVDGDRSRLSRRTGLSRFSDRAIESASAVRAAAGAEVTARAGSFNVGDPQVTDDFTEANTSNGDLGDRFNNATLAAGADGTNDYYICLGTANTKNSSISAAWSSGRGPAIQSNEVVDTISPQTSNHALGRPMWAAISRLSLSTSNAFVLELQATTASSLTGKQGNVGFILFADAATINAGSTDDSTMLMIERIGTSGLELDTNPYRNNTSTSFTTLLEIHEDTSDVAMTWQAATTYTFRLYVDGDYGELWIKEGSGDFQFKQRWTSLRRWYKSASVGAEFETVSNSNSDVGFLTSNVGHDGMFDSVDNFVVYSMEQRTFSVESVVAAACGNDIWIGDETDGFAIATGGVNVLNDSPDISMVSGPTSTDGEAPTAYALDGESAYKINLETGAASDWTASATDFPLDDNSLPPAYAVNYRGSACVFGFQSKPGYVVLSRRDEWDDFDITPTNANRNGREALPMNFDTPVTACVPFSNASMIVAGMAKSWLFDGDPRLGGQKLELSTTVGAVGPFAWATDDRAIPYWVSLYGFQTLGQGGPRLISEKRIDGFFRDINHDTSIVRCGWIAEYGGVLIAVQNRDSQLLNDGVFWHKLTNTFWPVRFPEEMGPTCLASIARPLASSRPAFLIGGWDGYLRKIDLSQLDDDGQSIIAYADISPIGSGGFDEIVLAEVEIITGRTSQRCYVEMRSAQDPDLLASASARTRRKFEGAGRLSPINEPIGGGALSIRIGADADFNGHFSIERVRAAIERSDEIGGVLSA